jgi:hypothetical protein
MPRINYKQMERLASEQQVELTRSHDEDGPCVHVHNCFADARDRFLRAVDRRWPGKYHRQYAGDMTVWLRVL